MSVLSTLIGAAELAEKISGSRNQQIRVELRREGLLILGYLLTDAGTPLEERKAIVNWMQIDGRPELIEQMIREVDHRLTETARVRSAKREAQAQ